MPPLHLAHALILILALLWWSPAAGRHLCDTAEDCQYTACVTYTGATVQAVCVISQLAPTDAGICSQRVWQFGMWNLLSCPDGPCRAGRYTTTVFRDGLWNVWCRPCPGGTYNTEPWTTMKTVCTQCAAGTYRDATTMAPNGTCAACPPGKLQPSAGESSCANCSAGAYQSGPAQTRCEACPAATYQARGGQSACDACAAGKSHAGSGATSAAACQNCAAGATFWNGTWCAACKARDAGQYVYRGCTPERDTEVRACKSSDECGGLVLSECGNTSDAQCAGGCGDAATALEYGRPRAEDLAYVDLAVGRCKGGEFLVRPVVGPGEARECRRCPEGLVGLDGVTCEACKGPLEEPYWLDQAACVCKAPARMLAGGCVCPDGWQERQGVCARCPGNTSYGVGGRCYDCGAGNFSAAAGATSCARCGAGTFRVANSSQGCARCGNGLYAADAGRGADGCAPCNLSCGNGWRDAGSCLSYASGSPYRQCEPCPGIQHGQTFQNAVWRGECVFECNAGFFLYSNESGSGCAPCSTEACPAGRQWEDCAPGRDRLCDLECVPGSNGSMPLAHARWAPSRRAGECPWECEDGYAVVRSDYWLFAVYECVAQ